MRYLRCKCGDSTVWTSMGVQNCNTCDKCGSTYASHPDYHSEPTPHEWVTRYNEHTGRPYKMCNKCMKIDEESYEKAKVV